MFFSFSFRQQLHCCQRTKIHSSSYIRTVSLHSSWRAKLPEISSLTHFPFSVGPLDFCSPAPFDSWSLYCNSWPLPGLLQPGPCRGTIHFKLDLSFFPPLVCFTFLQNLLLPSASETGLRDMTSHCYLQPCRLTVKMDKLHIISRDVQFCILPAVSVLTIRNKSAALFSNTRSTKSKGGLRKLFNLTNTANMNIFDS